MDRLIIKPLIGIHHLKLGQVMAGNQEFPGAADPYIHGGDTWQVKDYSHRQISIQTDCNDLITCIEIRDRGMLPFEVILFGVNVFKTRAEKLVEIISKATGSHYLATDREIPYTYKFPDLSLGLAREYIPSDADSPEEGIEYETFGYIGIGTLGQM